MKTGVSNKELYKDKPVVYAASRLNWRKWLEKNHLKEKAIWLVINKKSSGKPGVDYAGAVEEALCFGWIDSVANKRDAESSYQYFTPRKPKSMWSKLNKQRVEKLEATGLMTEAGMRMVELAKATGTWDALNEVEEAIIPDDMVRLLKKKKTAEKHFLAFSVSVRKQILSWILSAKTPATREKRIKETVELAARNVKANQWVPKK